VTLAAVVVVVVVVRLLAARGVIPVCPADTDMCSGCSCSASDLIALVLLALEMEGWVTGVGEGGRGELRGDPGEFLETAGDIFLRGVAH